MQNLDHHHLYTASRLTNMVEHMTQQTAHRRLNKLQLKPPLLRSWRRERTAEEMRWNQQMTHWHWPQTATNIIASGESTVKWNIRDHSEHCNNTTTPWKWNTFDNFRRVDRFHETREEHYIWVFISSCWENKETKCVEQPCRSVLKK